MATRETIIGRAQKDDSTAYLAQVIIKRKGKICSQGNPDLRPAAKAWMTNREAELAKPAALGRREDPNLFEVIDRYRNEMRPRQNQSPVFEDDSGLRNRKAPVQRNQE